MTETICEQLGIAYDYSQKLNKNIYVSSDGTLGSNSGRSSFSVKLIDGATQITSIKMDGVQKVPISIGWFSQEPNLLDNSGFINRSVSLSYPINIPSNAKWCIATFANTDLGSVINVTQSPYTAVFPKSISDIDKRLSIYAFPSWRDERRLSFDNETKIISIYGIKTAPSTDHKLVSFSSNGIYYTISDSVESKVLTITANNASLAVPVSQSDITYSLDDLVVFQDAAEHSGYIKIASFVYQKLSTSGILCNIKDLAYDGFNKSFQSVDDITDNGIYRIKSSNEYSILFVCNNNNILYQTTITNKYGIKTRFKAGSAEWSDWKSVDTWILANTQKIYASIHEGKNYNNYVVDNSTIGSNGVLETFFKYLEDPNREVLFFKLGSIGVAPSISGCSILAYAWYSGFPDYVMGSNFISRTTTNTPPSNAEYCGLILNGYTNIVITGENMEARKVEINLLGSALNNSIGENCFANGVRTNLKILGYGNSFMRNSVAYLSSIAKGCGVNLTVGNLYTGGTYLQNHLTALINNSAVYEWHKYVDGTETQTQGYQTPLRGLLEERWDAIILHQYNVQNHPFEPTLNRFIATIIDKIGYCPKIYINATWAFHEDLIEETLTEYYANETEMWSDMLVKCNGACKDSGVAEFSIIPTGTAIQNARTLRWADDYIRFCNGGTDLHHLNPAGGFIAACTIFQKVVTPLNGIPCSNTTFRITSATAMPPSSDVQQGILVTDDNYLPLCQAAIKAVENPYVITTITES